MDPGLVITLATRKGTNPPPPPREAKPPAPPNPPPLAQLQADPDFVDRVFEYCVSIALEVARRELVERRAELTQALREEFAGERVYVRRPGVRSLIAAGNHHPLAARALELFNGRNASEIARVLGISRATVYRLLKQAGRATS